MAPSKPQTQSFDEFIAQSELPVLVDFWADWCGPCKMMEPIIKEIAHSLKGKLNVIKVNVDRKQHIAARYQVRGIPTFILFKDGKVAWQTSGAMPAHALKQQLEAHL